MSAKSLMRRLDKVIQGKGRKPVDWAGLDDYRAGLRKEPPAEFARYFERRRGAGAGKPTCGSDSTNPPAGFVESTGGSA